MLSNFACFFVCLLIFIKKKTFQNYLWNTISMPNSLGPDPARHYVGPDLGTNVYRGYHRARNLFWTYCGASGLNFSLVLTPVELVLKSGILKETKHIFQ